MSLCHIWFGVADSNRRAGAWGFLRVFGFGVVSPLAFRCRRTVSGLALRQKNRRRICEMRFVPCAGFSRFSATIFACTAATAPFTGREEHLFGCSPASPCSRYCRTQSKIVPLPSPNSAATRGAGRPSSKYSCTALRLIS